jgi:hypothetical protein
MRKIAVIMMLSLAGSAFAQGPTLRRETNYKGWGWEAWVADNGLITTATVAAIGARVMQYDLGGHPSIYVNPAEYGKTYTPVQGAPWHNFGGFKNWPAPQAPWNWPPPPTIDFAAYTVTSAAETADSVAVLSVGPSEKWLTPKIHFERLAVMYAGSSRVRMQQTLVNDGTSAVEWGVWDITQSIVNHTGLSDYANFWVYFPVTANSLFGSDGVRWDNSSSAWKGEVAPGVYGVQFLPENKKIFADSPEGWVAYTDKKDGYVYCKTYDLVPGANYPDQGAHNEVWISGGPVYFEVEVVGPVVRLAAGGRTTFTENWWAAKMRAPVIDVNEVGATAQKLVFASSTLSGVYGVFYQGTARITALDAGGGVLAQGSEHPVTPLEEFVLEESFTPPINTASVQIRIFDRAGAFIGVLDDATISGVDAGNSPESPSGFRLERGFPNPFNGSVTLRVTLPVAADGSLVIYGPNGKAVETVASGRFSAGTHPLLWEPRTAASGVYVAVFTVAGARCSEKLMYLK